MLPSLILPTEAITGLIEVSGGALCAVAGWAFTNYKSNSTKADREESREYTKEIVRAELKPALLEANDTLLNRMNGTYLRTAEARIEFANIKDGIAKLETRLDRHHQALMDKPSSSSLARYAQPE